VAQNASVGSLILHRVDDDLDMFCLFGERMRMKVDIKRLCLSSLVFIVVNIGSTTSSVHLYYNHPL
jgi:hypothetical protein